jgi:hypothetical protein
VVQAGGETDGIVVVVKPGEMADVKIDVVKLAKVTGRVLDADTGQVVPNVPVQVSAREVEDGQAFPDARVTTGVDGKYTYYAPPGFDVSVDLAGHWTHFRYRPPPFERVGGAPADVKLTAGGHMFADMAVRRRKSAKTTLAATVTDPDGKAVAATAFMIDDYPLPRTRAIAAGKTGVIHIPGLDVNDVFALRVRHENAVNLPAAVSTNESPMIRVAKENACFVAGQVTDTKGRPVPRAQVALQWKAPLVGKRLYTGHFHGRSDEEHIGLALSEPGEQCAEQPRRDAAVALAIDAGQPFFQLIAEEDARRHGVGDAKSLANVLFRRADKRTHEGTDVENQSRPAGFIAEALRKCGFSGAWNAQRQDATRPNGPARLKSP